MKELHPSLYLFQHSRVCSHIWLSFIRDIRMKYSETHAWLNQALPHTERVGSEILHIVSNLIYKSRTYIYASPGFFILKRHSQDFSQLPPIVLLKGILQRKASATKLHSKSPSWSSSTQSNLYINALQQLHRLSSLIKASCTCYHDGKHNGRLSGETSVCINMTPLP